MDPIASIRIICRTNETDYSFLKETEFLAPLEERTIENIINKMGITSADSKVIVQTKWLDSYLNNALSFLSTGHDINNIFELNYLAKRLQPLSDEDRLRFAAICDYKKMYTTPISTKPILVYGYQFHTGTVAEAINYSFNISHDIKVVHDTRMGASFGRFIVENGLLPFKIESSQEIIELLDYDRIFHRYRENVASQLNGGVFVEDSFVYNLPSQNDLVLPYDGKSLLLTTSNRQEPLPIDGSEENIFEPAPTL